MNLTGRFVNKKNGITVTFSSSSTAQFIWKTHYWYSYYGIKWGLVSQGRLQTTLVFIPPYQQTGIVFQQHSDVNSSAPSYDGLVNGICTMDYPYYLYTFTLSNLQSSFEGLYGCGLFHGSNQSDIDFVYLQIRGRLKLFRLFGFKNFNLIYVHCLT